ncbi:MAG: sulfatase [Pseudomonadota bacterium]|nr:sulfatase [Pseudomonadota bacterium]
MIVMRSIRTLLPVFLALSAGGCLANDGPGVDGTPSDETGRGEPADVKVDLGDFRPRNVVIVQVDTLRADALPRWGSLRGTLPRLDARSGWIGVDRAVSTGSWTAPATASLLSGSDQPTHGVRFFDDTGPNQLFTVPSFAPYLAEQGFATALVTGNQVLLTRDYELGHGFGVSLPVVDEPGNAAGAVGLAVDWLDTLSSDEPFLLFLQPMDAHSPYRPEQEDLWTWADPADMPFNVDDPSFAQENQIGDALEDAETEEDRARILESVRAIYDEQILGVDRAIDTLMAALEARGRLDETLIVVTADHGESFFDGPTASLGHGQSLRNELVHVPLLFWGPGVTDAHLPCVASNMDVFPTIVDALGLPPLPSAEGRSLLEGCREQAFSGLYSAAGGVETLEYVGVESLQGQVIYGCRGGGVLAFDLVADPLASNTLPVAEVPDGVALAAALDAYVAGVVTTLPWLTCAATP